MDIKLVYKIATAMIDNMKMERYDFALDLCVKIQLLIEKKIEEKNNA